MRETANQDLIMTSEGDRKQESDHGISENYLFKYIFLLVSERKGEGEQDVETSMRRENY